MATKLTTLAKVKAFLGLTSGTFDGFIDDLIDSVSDHAERQGIGAERTLTDETSEGTNHSIVFTKFRPINSVSSLTIDDSPVATSDFQVFGGAGYIRLLRRIIDSQFRDLDGIGPIFPQGALVKITYLGGFKPIPADLDMYARLAAAHLFKLHGGDTNRLGLSSAGLGSQPTSFIQDFPPEVERYLKPFKRRGFASNVGLL